MSGIYEGISERRIAELEKELGLLRAKAATEDLIICMARIICDVIKEYEKVKSSSCSGTS